MRRRRKSKKFSLDEVRQGFRKRLIEGIEKGSTVDRDYLPSIKANPVLLCELIEVAKSVENTDFLKQWEEYSSIGSSHQGRLISLKQKVTLIGRQSRLLLRGR